MMFENWCGTCHHNLDQHTGPDGSCISRFNPGNRICLCARFVPAELPRLRATLDAQAQELAALRASARQDALEHYAHLAVVHQEYEAQLATLRAERDGVGLSVDTLDVDRLRQWAGNLETYGSDVTHWASVSFLVQKLRELADAAEQNVRDVGVLRAERDRLRADLLDCVTARDTLLSLVSECDSELSAYAHGRGIGKDAAKALSLRCRMACAAFPGPDASELGR